MNYEVRLYTSLVQSSLLYGSEARTLKQDDEKRLQAFPMMAQCRVLQINC